MHHLIDEQTGPDERCVRHDLVSEQRLGLPESVGDGVVMGAQGTSRCSHIESRIDESTQRLAKSFVRRIITEKLAQRKVHEPYGSITVPVKGRHQRDVSVPGERSPRS